MRMKINNLNLKNLRNEEHFQYQTDFRNLLNSSNPVALNVEAALAAYNPIYTDESEALDVIRKSAITDELTDADTVRDTTFKGLRDAIKSAVRHFNPDVQQAAVRLQVVTGHYGNISTKPYDEETAAINSMITEMNTTYAADLAATGLAGWVAELQSNNDAFDALKRSRYSEDSSKTQLRMKQVRIALDAAYTAITDRIDALVLINGEAAYSTFVNELNSRIESYSNLLAQRKGRNAKNAVNPDAPVV